MTTLTLAAIRFSPAADLYPLLAGALAALTCGLLGNFLVLRRLSLMGDAISHSVLPGLVIAFLITASRSPLPMFIGAATAGLLTVGLVELLKRMSRIEPGAAMGVVFTTMFALGVLLIEQSAARQVDLDADCVLHGQLETLIWYGAPERWSRALSLDTLAAMPRPVVTLAVMLALTVAFIGVLFKELRLAAFDPAMASTQGFSAGLLHALLMTFVAAATVASFEAVGAILVIAMLICPAATARLLTDRLLTQLACSAVVALLSATLGYLGAIAVPAMLGKDAVNAAGSMTVVSGLLLMTAILLAPRHGLLGKWLAQRKQAAASSDGLRV
jgi:manganese/zinc/iron transport system permease protein